MRKSTATKKCRRPTTIGLAVGLVLFIPLALLGGTPKAMRTEVAYPDTLVLSGTVTQDAEYRGGIILSTQVIESGNVTYMAETEIVLNPGFEIMEGAGFGTIMERDSIHQVRMLTFNLWCKSNAGQEQTIRDSRADVVSVQEVKDAGRFNRLRTNTGLSGTMCVTDGEAGIGMLWRPETVGAPIRTKDEIVKTPDDGSNKKRGYMMAEFKDFCFVSTHYSLNQKHRNEMSQKILNHSIVKDCQTANKPVYVAGDMNDADNGESIKILNRAGFVILNDTADLSHATFPYDDRPKQRKYLDLILEWNPNPSPYYKRLDRGIPVAAEERNQNLLIEDRTWLKKVSDHYPYSVRIKVK